MQIMSTDIGIKSVRILFNPYYPSFYNYPISGYADLDGHTYRVKGNINYVRATSLSTQYNNAVNYNSTNGIKTLFLDGSDIYMLNKYYNTLGVAGINDMQTDDTKLDNDDKIFTYKYDNSVISALIVDGNGDNPMNETQATCLPADVSFLKITSSNYNSSSKFVAAFYGQDKKIVSTKLGVSDHEFYVMEPSGATQAKFFMLDSLNSMQPLSMPVELLGNQNSPMQITGLEIYVEGRSFASLTTNTETSVKMFAVALPSKEIINDVNWYCSSSNNAFEYISSQNSLRTLNVGNGTLYVSTKDGKFIARCDITVNSIID